MNSETMEMMGYNRVYDYTQYSHDNDVNVIPEEDFKRLVSDTFKIIADNLRRTYGPYGSNVSMSEDNGETVTTKDGYNVFCVLGFCHQYKRIVYLAIKKIIDRMNENVGDGTTSCILLAEKIFNALTDLVKTPGNKRIVMDTLNAIEKDLQNGEKIVDDLYNGNVRDVRMKSFKNLIKVSSNYDEELTNILFEAFDPQAENADQFKSDPKTVDNACVAKVRNVIPDAEIDYSPDTKATFTIDRMPGNYRVRINMENDFGISLSEPTKVRIVVYDHAFNISDWTNFMAGYDKSSEMVTIIMARTFTEDFMDTEYVKYLSNLRLTKQPVRIFWCEVKGRYVRDEIKDLAAILDTDIHTFKSSKPVDFANLPQPVVQVYKGDCMCFFLDEQNIPTKYVENLEKEYKEAKESLVQKKLLRDRINALELKNEDTLITVKGSSSLEVKFIMDKIDDCTSIVRSAMDTGIVPNMFKYAYKRIRDLSNDYINNPIGSKVAEWIMHSIKGLTEDIFKSKHGELYASATKDINEHIKKISCSYDIMTEKECDVEDLPTSTQYDLEVVSAAISIVKYLLTSNAFIFNAHLMQMSGDRGHYEMG